MTLAVYARSLSGGYVYEDLLFPDQVFRPWTGVAGLATAVWEFPARSSDHVITALTHRWIGEGAPIARAVGLAWHLLNGLLLYAVARTRLSTAAAVIAVGVFWLHPLQAESVAYVAARPELAAVTWLLLALLASSHRWRGAAWICAALAVTGKELGVMTWALVPLWAWWTGQAWSRRARIAWGAGAALFAVLFVASLGRFTWTLQAPVVWAQIAELGRLLLLLPEALVHPQALTLDHDWTWIHWPAAFLTVWTLMVALLVAGCLRWPLWGLAVLWTIIAVLPRLLLPMPDGLHERHLASSLIAWSLTIGAWIAPRKDKDDDEAEVQTISADPAQGRWPDVRGDHGRREGGEARGRLVRDAGL